MVNEIEKKKSDLNKAIDQLATNGVDLAQKECEYKMAVTRKVLELRAENKAVSEIQLTIYGYDDIALLRLARDTAQVKYNANLEFINSCKLQLRLLEGQVQREWSNAN